MLADPAFESLYFLSDGCLWMPDIELLVLSDVHLGKSGHFQQSGLPVPDQHHAVDLSKLLRVIARFQPKKVLINGDLFHAGITRDVPVFKAWMHDVQKSYSTLDWILVKGNHDRFSDAFYVDLGFTNVVECWSEGTYGFVHDPADRAILLEAYPDTQVLVYGHVHCGMVLKGKGRQKLRLSAFAVEQNEGYSSIYLPAFGRFTGIKAFEPKPNRRFYLISEGQIMPFRAFTGF